MSRNVLSVSDALLEQAARFRARLADAPHDAALRARLETWKLLGPDHAQAYQEAERLWAAMGGAIAAAPRRTWRMRLSAVGVAAALAAVLLSPAMKRTYDDWRSDVVVPVGERRNLVLADGSSIALNSDTALAVDVNGKSRNVRLFRGQAFFTVAHDPRHPFRVRAGDAMVSVLGTRFDVRMTGDETGVTVEQGRVRLDGPAGQSILAAEMQGAAGPMHTIARAAISSDVTAWRRGRAVFYDVPLGVVLADLERYRVGAVYLANPALRTKRITGAFRTDEPDVALQAIKKSLGARSLALPTGVFILF